MSGQTRIAVFIAASLDGFIAAKDGDLSCLDRVQAPGEDYADQAFVDAVDVVVLCSGDGDFVPLVQRLKREGKRVEVAAFRAATDDALIKAADGFVPLDGRFRMTT